MNHHKKYKLNEIRQCPYCRNFIESLLPRFKPSIYKPCDIITESPSRCIAILNKSGKRKGEMCGCMQKSNSKVIWILSS